MNRTIKSAVLVSIVLLGAVMTGCSVKAPSNDGRKAIEEALRESIQNNERLEKTGKLKPSVKRALTPELEIALGRKHRYVSDAPRFDVIVNSIPVKDFFAGLVKDAKYNIIVDPAISGLITLNLRQVTIAQVMEAVRDAYGYEFEETAYGFRVFPKQLETKVFRLNYIDIARRGSSYTTMSAARQISSNAGGGAGGGPRSGHGDAMSNTGGSVDTESEGKFWEVLKENLDALISSNKDSGAVVVVNQTAGTVIAKAYPGDLRAIARYLNKVQSIIQRQVIIEAKILEVELSAEFNTGIDWKLFGIHQTVPGSSIDSNFAFGAAMDITATGGSAFNSAITLLNYQGNVNVLSSPRVATLNNQKAVIKVGTDRVYVTNVSSDTNTSGSNAVTTSSMTLTPYFSGISLDVTPQIDEDDNVTIHIHPIISTVTDDLRTFTVNGQSQSLPLARSEMRESDTVVRAKSGQVIVIGGLMKSNNRMYTRSTPVLDQIPLVNNAFKSTARGSGKFELVILLRPVIANGANWQKQLKEAAINISRMKDNDEYRYRIEADRPDSYGRSRSRTR